MAGSEPVPSATVNGNGTDQSSTLSLTASKSDVGSDAPPQPAPPQPLIPSLQASDTAIEKQPGTFGMRVATQDGVNDYEKYVKNGGDPNQIPIYDRLAVAIAKNPNFLTSDEGFESYYGLVYKPLKQQAGGEVFQKFLQSIGPTIGDTAQNLGAAAVNNVRLAADQSEMAFRKVTGQTGDPGYQALSERLAKELATEAQGAGQIVSDTWNLASGTYNGILQTTKPLAMLAFGHDAKSRDEIDRAYAKALQQTVAGQQALAGLGKQLQSGVAKMYQGTAAYADIGQKMQNATPDERAAAGLSFMGSPLNFVGGEAGEAVVGAFKPIFYEKGMQALEDAAGANARKLVLDSSQILPENPELSSANPGYIPTRNVQAKLAPDARQAAQDVATAQQNVADRLTTIGKIAGDPSTATGFAANLLKTAGNALDTAGDVAKKINDAPEAIAHVISGGNPVIKGALTDVIEKGVFGSVLHHWGPIGVMVETGLEHLPKVAEAASDLLGAMGKELAYGETSIPYWTRVAQQTKNMPKGMAAFLDSPLIQTATSMAGGGAAGAVTTGALGGLQAVGSGQNGLQGFLSGAAQGGIFGMAGGGFGQWQKFRNPNEYLLAARGDWKRYRDMLSPTEQQNFNQLSSTNQLMLAQHAQHFPGLRVDYINDPNGPKGFHYFDQANRSNIQINLAAPDSVIRGTLAHELIHGATTSGMLPEILDTTLGNPQRGHIGWYTALDAKGDPIGVDPNTGRYLPNQDFANIRAQYLNQMTEAGLPTSHLTDTNIVKEIYAEHGVDYMLGGGALVDAGSAFRPGMFSQSAMKTALAKIGYTFDETGKMIGAPGGTISGTGLFSDLQRNPDLMKLAQSYFQKGMQEGSINSEEQPTRRFTRRDMQNPNAADTWFTNSADIVRDQDGKVVRNPLTGEPQIRTPSQVEEYNAKFAQAVRSGLSTLSDDQKMDLGLKTGVEGNMFVRYLPDNILDSLAATNEYNPHQIANLKMLSRVLADKGSPGMEMRLFYQKALTAGKKYGSFEGTEKIAVPYGFEITKDNNINIKSVDFNQLNKNYARVSKREPFKTLWKSPDEFVQDAHTYFVNHSQGRPGAEGIGEQKRDAINSLANFGTEMQRETNPLVGTMPNSVRPIIKSYRIDRANQISATGAIRPFISEEQYHKMNRNYLPSKGAGFESISPEDFIAARNKSDRPEFLSELKPEDLAQHRLFTNADRTVGVALSPQGDIQNVFNNSNISGAGAYAVAHAINQGGRTLDAFDGYLPRYYRQMGFQETGRMKFNDEFSPANWDYAKRGRPDVVFMGWNGYRKGPTDAIARAQGPEIHWLPNERSTRYSNDWDGQKSRSRTFATGTADYRLPGEGRRPQTYAARSQPGAGAGEAGGEPVAPDNTAIPVTYRTTRTGKTVEQEIPYGISNAPLVADKQPPANLQDNNFKHVDFLTAPEQQKLTHLDKASAVTDFADKIVQDYDRWKGSDWAKEAKNWYRDVRKYLRTAFGGDQELFGHLLAATSAGQGVVMNWKDALEAYQRYRMGHYDDAIREFKRTGQITEDMKPTKANGAKFGQNSDEVLKVLAGTWFNEVKGPKTPNFFRNLFGRGTDATIDMWAARTMRRLGYEGVEGAPEQWRIQPPSESGVSDLDFAFSQQAFRQAADRLGMKAHELQAIMWYAEKHLWAERGWAKGGAQAAKESYVPRLKEFAEQVSAAGGPQSPGYLPRLQRYVQGR